MNKYPIPTNEIIDGLALCLDVAIGEDKIENPEILDKYINDLRKSMIKEEYKDESRLVDFPCRKCKTSPVEERSIGNGDYEDYKYTCLKCKFA